MLVLTRKAGESISIGDDVEVRIVSIRGQKVRLAIEAPRTMSVRRKELDKDPGMADDRLRLTRAEQPQRAVRSTARRRAAS